MANEKKYEAFGCVRETGVAVKFRFFADSKALAEDHAAICFREGHVLHRVVRLPADADMSNAGTFLLLIAA